VVSCIVCAIIIIIYSEIRIEFLKHNIILYILWLLVLNTDTQHRINKPKIGLWRSWLALFVSKKLKLCALVRFAFNFPDFGHRLNVLSRICVQNKKLCLAALRLSN
jgi:hypothetical protein